MTAMTKQQVKNPGQNIWDTTKKARGNRAGGQDSGFTGDEGGLHVAGRSKGSGGRWGAEKMPAAPGVVASEGPCWGGEAKGKAPSQEWRVYEI